MKFAMVIAVLFIIVGIAYGTELFNFFLISVVTAVGSVGDLVIYPRKSNKVAIAGHFVLYFIIIWLLAELWVEPLETSMLMPALFPAP